MIEIDDEKFDIRTKKDLTQKQQKALELIKEKLKQLKEEQK